MKINQSKIFASLATATVLAFSIVLSVSVPTGAIDAPQQALNGLFRSSSEDFFRSGRRQFEREIQILQQRRLSSEEPILNISDELRIQEQLSPLEMRNNSSSGVDKPGMKRAQNFGRGEGSGR